jgi:hypothetical protein
MPDSAEPTGANVPAEKGFAIGKERRLGAVGDGLSPVTATNVPWIC